ncbi:hypothetical protein [Pantoea agglomerans]|uniref:hypothetical protein n=1 Tax=Enterobacter agglomerans TaxID=549 RepID=UPI003209D2F9
MLEEKRRREKEDAGEKREAEFRYINTELIFRQEEFARKCALVAADYGVALREDADLVASVSEPVLTLEDIDGEWKSVPPELLYFILELPVRLRAVGLFLMKLMIISLFPLRMAPGLMRG